MLLGDLYKIEKQEKTATEGEYLFRLKIDKSHDIFKGHFPEKPVLPGVCQLEMVKEVLGKIMEKELKLTNAQNIKYIDIVDPNVNEYIYLKLTIQNLEEGIKVSAVSTFENGNPNFKFSGRFV